MELINFDNNATTKIAPTVLIKMNEIYGFSYNPSSTHSLGRRAAMLVEGARLDLSDALNATNYDIFFTSGGTEANNMALFGDNYDVILYSKIEHSSVYNTRPRNAVIIEFGVDKNGVVDLTDLERKLDENCKGKNFLVSIMLANSETGAIQPVKEATKLIHQKGGLIHSDMVQAFGKIKIDLEDLNVDFATISSHKINGPQGAGAIFVRHGIDIQPIIFGGGQERGKRNGTLNVAAIVGFGEAAKMVEEKIMKMEEVCKIRDFIESEVAKIAGDNVIFFSQNVKRTPNTSFMALKNADSQTQMIHFDLNKIMVSAGSACSSGSVKPSRVLESMSVAKEFLSAIRVSLCPENTRDEAKKFVTIFEEFYNKIRK
ncbi:MAG TPA: cysteine desulfurase family protein [Rickettsiales bacterium]|nr:cysteine desulfurase family protein [Rickettsiales bacterium]